MYFDDVAVTMVANGGPFAGGDGPQSIDLINAGFEQRDASVDTAGDLAGWLEAAGDAGLSREDGSAPTPRTAVACLRGGSGSSWEAEQKRHLVGEGFRVSDIDAGNVNVAFSGWYSSVGGDRARLGLRFYQADGTTQVGSTEYGPWRTPAGDSVWAEDTLTVTAPSGARVVGFVQAGDNTGGGSNATGAWDDVSATIELVGLGSAVKGRRVIMLGMAMCML